MVGEKMDKAKLLAYVLGELDRDETLAMAKQVEQDPELKKEILSLQGMTQKLDEAFMVTEDFQLKASQQQKIRLQAHKRTVRKKWMIFGSAFATLAIVSVTVLKQRQAEQRAAQPIQQLIVQAPPPTFENKVVSPPETTWEGSVAAAPPPPAAEMVAGVEPSEFRPEIASKGRGKDQQVARNERLAQRDTTPATKSAKAKSIAPIRESETIAMADKATPKKEGLLGAFGGAPQPQPLAKATAPEAQKGTQSMLVGNADVAANGLINEAPIQQETVAEAGRASPAEDSIPTRFQAPQAPEEFVRIQVDPRLSSVPAAFHPSLLSALVKNLNNSTDCFSGRPLPARTDMTVEVSARGDILSVNLLPHVPDNEAAILCLKDRMNRTRALLKPKTNKPAQFEVRINLK